VGFSFLLLYRGVLLNYGVIFSVATDLTFAQKSVPALVSTSSNIYCRIYLNAAPTG
jgi:hypothetical protein